jgi:hypothetical protein
MLKLPNSDLLVYVVIIFQYVILCYQKTPYHRFEFESTTVISSVTRFKCISPLFGFQREVYAIYFHLSSAFDLVFPNVIVEWLELQHGIRDARGTNLGQKTRSPDKGFCGFPQSFHPHDGIVI